MSSSFLPTKQTPIILIGPMAAAKSSVAVALAKILGRPNIPLDRVRGYYYIKDGLDVVHETSLPSFQDTFAYWKPFEVKAVQRVVEEFPHGIIDFGAGHSVYTDKEQFEQVRKALEDIPNVFLTLPCPDRERALAICNERLRLKKGGRPISEEEITSNKHFVEHDSNYLLAKKIFYSEGKSPEEVAAEIHAHLRTNGSTPQVG